ncbi:hypothetical protein DV515_00011734 [Chloebia gouldiae]|uniref:Uncharacterized protein n=1 Tax=Chloebia gouldiae TaxID=44316 RepID=A0A3L8S6U8_CHLGU|nr:hypothetical protein DV515_00011734 [Chloebia gouldiae]
MHVMSFLLFPSMTKQILFPLRSTPSSGSLSLSCTPVEPMNSSPLCWEAHSSTTETQITSHCGSVL